MHKIARTYVKAVDTTSRWVGFSAMFLVLGMIGLLLFESLSRTFFNSPHVWSIEFSQFVMAAYYTLGGAYTLIVGGHVRMDLLYHRWSPRKKAAVDVATFLVVGFYLAVLLIGAFQGTAYAITYNQVSYSAWRPSLVPIKIIMTLGISLMFLQTISELIKDIAVLRGEDISDLRKVST